MGVAGVGVGAVLGALPALRCGCGGPRRGALGPRGVRPPRPQRAGGSSVTSRGSGAARRGRSLGSLCTLSALLCTCGGSQRAPGARAGGTPCAGGAPGAVVGAAARLTGAAVSAPCAPGAPSGGGAAGLAALAAGTVSLAGAGPRVNGPVSAEAARGCPIGGPTSTSHYLPVYLCCAVGSAVQCSAGGRGGGVGGAEVA